MLGDAVAVAIAQQRDAVGAGTKRTRTAHRRLHRKVNTLRGLTGIWFDSATSTSPLGSTSIQRG